MISGFNTDIEYEGTIYHVQTEDKGLETPLILSLIYTGGRILASKRTPYNDLLDAGFDEKVLAERLNRQHKVFCAAIKTGRLDDLIRLSQREAQRRQQPEADETRPEIILAEEVEALPEPELWFAPPSVITPPPASSPSGPPAFLFFEPVATPKLSMHLATEQSFSAGSTVALEVMLHTADPHLAQQLARAVVTAKIMGTSFRPQQFMFEANADGRALLFFNIPSFKTGRAALLLRAELEGCVAELRRIVLPEQP